MTNTDSTPIPPDQLKQFFSDFIYIADSTPFSTQEVLTEEILNEMPGLRKRSLSQLIRLSQGLLLEVSKNFDTDRSAFDFLKSLSPSVLGEIFYFARMQGPDREKAIHALGSRLGPYVAKLPNFSPDGSRYHAAVQALQLSSEPSDIATTLDGASLGFFVDGKPHHYTLFNHLYHGSGKWWVSNSLANLASQPEGEADLARKIGLLLKVDPDARDAILTLISDEQLKLHHHQTPNLRRMLGQSDLTPSECSRRLAALIKGLGRDVAPADGSFCAQAIKDCPRYREHALVPDLIDAMRLNLTVSQSVKDTSRFEASRLASFEKLLEGRQLSQSQINRVACQGILSMNGGDYLELQDTGLAHAVIKLLERHTAKESLSPGRDYANRVFVLGLLKHSDPQLLKQAAALKEEYAISLYALTGKSIFLKFVKNETNRDNIFSGDLGL